jgi:hypothetical protein
LTTTDDLANTNDRNKRFLIALAKLFGVNPTPSSPLAGIQVCDDWFIQELLSSIVSPDGSIQLTIEGFNQLMLNCRRAACNDSFFNYFFSKADSIQKFENSVENFRIRALWLFGNFKFAYKALATLDESDFQKLISRTEPRSDSEFRTRPEFNEIEAIPVVDLGYLGYVSGQALDNFDLTVTTMRLALSEWDKHEGIFDRLGPDKKSLIRAELIKRSVSVKDATLAGLDRTEIDNFVKSGIEEVAQLRTRQKNARKAAERNTHRYLTLPYLDVYVATSMRSDEDFVAQSKFVKSVFSHPEVSDLHLRYFDPTASFVEDRVTKGLIECLMLRRAKVTIYNAGAEDTMGKDSELAATLAQGKPVIVFVPKGSPQTVFTCSCGYQKTVDLDRRAKIFRADHPLGLQISASTGVAHGIVVVRSEEECARMLRKVLLHDLEFSIRHENGNFLLEEKETRSILRVASDDPLLTHSFWSYFRDSQPEFDI